MLRKGIFKKPNNRLEDSQVTAQASSPSVPESMYVRCDACRATMLRDDLQANALVCTHCGYHLRMGARQRIVHLTDEGSFREMHGELVSRNLIDFPGYDEKLRSSREVSGENEAVITGIATIGAIHAVFCHGAQFYDG